MSTLIELTAQIVSAHVTNMQMTADEMLQELQKVHVTLKALGSGASKDAELSMPLTIKQAFKKDEVICMICGKGGFKTLKRHLTQAHDLKPGQYRKQFNIPSSLSLTARSYSESRKRMAIDKGLGEGLAKARELKSAKSKEDKAPVPAVRVKPAVPAVKVKASVPAVRKKAAVPAKVQAATTSDKPSNAINE
ncbi:MAG: MucR family transcriptional regulator [Oryzomonas sp.]|uniref:MucR family transcriptional regulator n=1 Tax=Oryzomonas sp. TaxID=2855186 RepID=UPI002840C13F|nr:MucR family transcriptional regulator [Oryzomonas sp.]MDR3579126.1 MucR family transcriptional regulator [Oryzomonas sp.]